MKVFVVVAIQVLIRLKDKIMYDLFLSRYSSDIKTADIAFFSAPMNWRQYLHKNNLHYFSDVMLGDMIEETKKSRIILCIDSNFESILSFDITRKKKKFIISKNWTGIQKYISYHDIFTIFFDIILNDVIDKHSNLKCNRITHEYLERLIEKTAFRLINQHKLKILFFSCEDCFPNFLLIDYAKKRNIPCIALQHGVVCFPLWAKVYPLSRTSGFLPDITCLYGEADKENFLEYGIHSPEQLIITGSPRYDIIYHADRIYSREKFCTGNNIPLNHQIILWTTQSHGMTDEENIRQLNLVFGACDGIPDITLVIKQHPGERKKHYRLIQSYRRRHSCNSLILPKDSDTFEALYASNLVITFHSTTGREAVAFKKPLIVLDPQDWGGYCREDVGILVSSIQEAKQVISRLLRDDKELAVNREKYISRYFFAIDGKSTERVVQLIEKVLSDQVKPVTL